MSTPEAHTRTPSRHGPDTRLIAFYGTLREGMGGAVEGRLTSHLRARGPCEIRGGLLHVCHTPSASYPGLVDGDGTIIGELYELPGDASFAALDAHEGPEYERRIVRLLHPDLDCWVYLYTGPRDGKPPIPGGDWAKRNA